MSAVFSRVPGTGVSGDISLMSVLVEVVCFCIAFAVIRAVFQPQHSKGGKPGRLRKKACDVPSVPQDTSSFAAWHRASAKGPVTSQDLQTWAARVFAEQPEGFVNEFVSHLAKHTGCPEHADVVNHLLDVPAKAGRPDLVKAFVEAAKKQAGVEVDATSLHHALVSASAASGQTREVEELLATERTQADGHKVAVKSFASAVRGYLKCGKLVEAVAKLEEMQKDGHEVPSSALTELSRAACRVGMDFLALLDSLDGKLKFPSEALSPMMDHCCQHDDLTTAKAIQSFAANKGMRLPEDASESLLKLHSKANDASSVEVLSRMLADGFVPCEGLCRFLIARCADSRNIAFAEALADFLRGRKEMTYATYKTLMKVYAFAALYDKACDLYTEIKALGMEPDPVMYGSLLKFAVKAGKTSLSREIFDKAYMVDGGCVQNYMWLIRAAGQEGDVDRAVSIFRKLQESQPKLVDPMAYNITIDACASNKDMAQAKELFEEMQQTHACNLVTYNTLMKGYLVTGDIQSAKRTLKDVEAAGISPDSASFSCLLSGAIKLGNFKEVWNVIEEMDRRGIAPDAYVVSIMVQAARKAHNPRDADRLLSILDRSDVRLCEDEVVFNTVLDACIYRRDKRRLMRTLDEYPRSKVQPTVRTFGLLIKACSVLKRTQRCWDFWNAMVKERGILPIDVTLGCMIDALVEAQRVEEALALFQEWKTKVKCDTIIYSTLIKGFSNLGDPERAMALYRDMKENNVLMNHIVYTALINAHTRNGLMAKAEALLEDMQKEGCEPNTITYSSLVKGHCAKGDLEAAFSLFHKMMDLGFEADAVIFNTLLDGCVQKGNWALGDELLSEMQRLDVQPTNFTLSIMVKMWSKRGELDKAFECVYSALRDPSGYRRVDAQVGACIVGACIHNRNPQRALQVFEDMKTWRNFDGPDTNTYSALISGLPRHGLVRKAVELTDEACRMLFNSASGQDRRPLAANALRQLYRSLKQEGLLQELGIPLEGKLRRVGMAVDEQWLA